MKEVSRIALREAGLSVLDEGGLGARSLAVVSG